ncbi:MAG: sensor histidine kinase [Nocardioides sp.]
MRTRSAPAFVDALLALALLGLTMATLIPGGLPGSSRADHAVALTLASLAVVPVALRQRAPVVTLLVVAAALAGYGLLGYGEWPSGAVGLVVAIFTVATLRPVPVALAVTPVVVGVVVLLKTTDDGVTWPEVLQALLVCVCAWAVGAGTRRWSREAQDAAARGERLLAEERIRIARELHDVVAHHMSVVALQTGVAGYVLESDPVTAQQAVATAGSASREALQEMGRLLDALRTDETPSGALAPQPGLGQLDDLVARMRDVGLDVRLHRRGRPWQLSTGLELCVFRIVQESLTNVLKHAGPGTRVEVVIQYAEDRLAVTVDDDGRGRTPRGVGSSRGIDGMRERADLYGGTLVAAQRPGGGFRVRLEVPAELSVDAEGDAGAEQDRVGR